jgi:hypothetical protein
MKEDEMAGHVVRMGTRNLYKILIRNMKEIDDLQDIEV